MLTTALSFAGCAATKKTQTQQTEQTQASSVSAKSDTASSQLRLIQTQPVPESRVSLAVSVDSLLKLPEGAAYRESNDRAHVEAKHQGGVIYITGTCDSLQRQVEYYEALYHTARDALEQTHDQLTQERQKRSEPLGDPILTFAMGLVAGILTTITIKLNRHGKE